MPKLFNPRVSRSFAGLGEGDGTLFSPYIDDRDLIEAAGAIFELSNWIEDVQVPLEAAEDIAREDMAERFVKQVDPNGRPWARLSDNYVIEKMRDGYPILPILTREGNLRKKATDKSSWFIAGNSVYLDTSKLPPYWYAHQQRGGRQPIIVKNAGVIRGKPFDDVKGGMPQRAFIGLSEEAENKILAMMDQWISTGMRTAEKSFKSQITVPTGMVRYAKGAGGRAQWRTAKGRFGPMV